jgi:lysophospholipase L1-like esterase
MVQPGASKMCLLRGLNSETAKEVEIIRATQAMMNETLTIPGIELDGELLPVRERALRLEVIGDSITSGEGAAGSANEQDWVSAFFSAANSYPWKLASKLDADVRVFSQSGFGVTCSWDGAKFGALPNYYEQETIFKDEPNNFAAWQPNAVVINLGTNDSGAQVDSETFKQGALNFLRLVRKHNPLAYILWAIGMLGTPFLNELQAALADFDDDNCALLLLPEVTPNALGAHGHPGEPSHELAAQTLYEHLRNRFPSPTP